MWKTDSVVAAVTGKDDDSNMLYSAMPVWNEVNLYWCLLAGKYDVDSTGNVAISENAYVAVVKVAPTTTSRTRSTQDVQMTVMASVELIDEYNNNTIAVTEEGLLFVTNGLAADGSCTKGYCYLVSYSSNAITEVWKKEYINSGVLKAGQNNIGSGTTPTVITNEETGKRSVAITDNAIPQMNVVIYDYDNGDEISKTPVFSKMRSGNEASVIGVNQSVFVPNNFGHTVAINKSQLVANEPGLAKVDTSYVDPITKESEVTWNQDHYTFYAMNMLARESGIIFSHSGDWYDEKSATEGPVYYILAIDSFDGRVIWRIPIGRGYDFCHEYGGIYFDRDGDKIFMGTNKYIICIQNEK